MSRYDLPGADEDFGGIDVDTWPTSWPAGDTHELTTDAESAAPGRDLLDVAVCRDTTGAIVTIGLTDDGLRTLLTDLARVPRLAHWLAVIGDRTASDANRRHALGMAIAAVPPSARTFPLAAPDHLAADLDEAATEATHFTWDMREIA